jgi:hypothetical protein
MSLPKGKSTRYYFRKGYARPCGRPRSTPALSTAEAAALVLGIIDARLRDGWSLDQIDWTRYCRDTAVVQAVTQQLNQHINHHPTCREASSWIAPR